MFHRIQNGCLLLGLLSPLMSSCQVQDSKATEISSVGVQTGYPNVPTYVHDIEFAVSATEDSLYLVSSSRELLVANCRLIFQYGNHLRQRNNLQLLADVEGACVPENINDMDRKTLRHPAQSRYGGESFLPEFLKFADAKINITRIFPIEIFSRTRKNRVYDGLCFNSAMVASGIFGFSHYSRFGPPLAALLGHWQMVFEKDVKGFSLRFQRSPWFSQIVKSEKTWQATSADIDKVKSEISDYVRNNFSPGSVLCLSSDKFLTAADKVAEVKKIIANSDSGVRVDAQIPPGGATIGPSWAHCLTFVTPHLLVESSNAEPHSFVSWAKAFPYYWNWMGGKQISFQYSQIQPAGIRDLAQQAAIFGPSSRFSSVQNVLRDFNNAYDGKSSVSVGEMIVLVERLKANLNSSLFVDFVEAKKNDQTSGFSVEVQIAYQYWDSVVEEVAKLQNSLKQGDPGSPFR